MPLLPCAFYECLPPRSLCCRAPSTNACAVGKVNQGKLAAAGIETPKQLLGKYLQLGRPATDMWCAAANALNASAVT